MRTTGPYVTSSTLGKPRSHWLPPLVRIALVHARFETINPFLNGSGRLLIAALLENWLLRLEALMYLIDLKSR